MTFQKVKDSYRYSTFIDDAIEFISVSLKVTFFFNLIIWIIYGALLIGDFEGTNARIAGAFSFVALGIGFLVGWVTVWGDA